MTHLEALTALRDKVERGVDTAHDHAAAFPSESAGGRCTWHDSHKASNNGSLDAAKALHEAVLPDWGASVDAVPRDDGFVAVWVSENLNHNSNARNADFRGYKIAPARAWLLAILEALIQMETTQ